MKARNHLTGSEVEKPPLRPAAARLAVGAGELPE